MTDYSHLKTGFFKAQIVAINPDKETLKDLFGEEVEEDPKYIWTKNNIRNAVVTIYLKDVYNDVFKYQIYLEEKNVVSNDSSKAMYINCVGDKQWVEDESQLWDSIKYFEKVNSWVSTTGVVSEKYQFGSRPKEKEIVGNKQPRIAIKGEPELLHLRKMLLEANPYDSDTYLFYNLERIFSGDFSQIEKDVNRSEFNFVAFAYVSNDITQKIWHEFLPLNLIREINNGMNLTSYSKKIFDSWKNNATGTYGIQGHYTIDKLQEFKKDFIKGKRDIEEGSSDY